MGSAIIKRNGKEYIVIKKEKISDATVLVTQDKESKLNIYVLFPEEDENHKGMAVPKKVIDKNEL